MKKMKPIYTYPLRFFKNFTTYIELVAYVLPVIAGSQINSSPELRSISILFLWIYFVAQLRVFKGIGIFIAGKDFSETIN